MIRYDLKCAQGHRFEGWFGSIGDYDDQSESGLLHCPECGTKHVEKAIMAPAVQSSKARSDAPDPNMIEAIRSSLAETCQDVGDSFAAEARAMHAGEKPARGIYGQATPKEAKALLQDGIPALPLPEILSPKRAKDKLN